jgi:nicotinamide-nucleotide amidase
MPSAILLSQGDEVVTGQIADTNAAWLATVLTDLGITVRQHVTVGDDLQAIESQVLHASQQADLVLSTGGLGPTEDDLTAAAVSNAFAQPLTLDEVALSQITELYQRYGRPMPAVNRKQAYLPEDAQRIDNQWGTAPGFAVRANDALLVFMPGVPSEMKKMFSHFVRPLLTEAFSLRPGRLVTLRTTGVGESTLQERIGSFNHDRIVLSTRTHSPENHLKLRIQPDVSDSEVRAICDRLSEKIGSPLFAIEGLEGQQGGSLPEVVGRALLAANASVAVAESCTGGRICASFTGLAGSSAWFLEGAITYSNAAKMRQLGVQGETLNLHGAVSAQVCQEMAAGVREAAGSTFGLATTGVAGPGGGSDEKPVGTVNIGLQTPAAFFGRQIRIPGGRDRVQRLSAAACIDLLRRHLQDFPLPLQ